MRKTIYDDDNQPMEIAIEQGMTRIWYEGKYWCMFLGDKDVDKILGAKEPTGVLKLIGK